MMQTRYLNAGSVLILESEQVITGHLDNVWHTNTHHEPLVAYLPEWWVVILYFYMSWLLWPFLVNMGLIMLPATLSRLLHFLLCCTINKWHWLMRSCPNIRPESKQGIGRCRTEPWTMGVEACVSGAVKVVASDIGGNKFLKCENLWAFGRVL